MACIRNATESVPYRSSQIVNVISDSVFLPLRYKVLGSMPSLTAASSIVSVRAQDAADVLGLELLQRHRIGR